MTFKCIPLCNFNISITVYEFLSVLRHLFFCTNSLEIALHCFDKKAIYTK
jgi:hypothetical protein